MSTRANTVIFSITDPTRATLDAFMAMCAAHFDKPNMILPLIGCYNGVEEPSFIVAEDTFNTVIADSGYIDGQESVLHVTGCNKAYATLHFLETGEQRYLGSMCAVSEEVARSRDAWTYRPDINAWFICEKVNPDHAGEIE